MIGPFGLGLFSDPQAILHVAELGVVMFLFIIGLEMQPQRLWSLRCEIFGLGLVQVTLCAWPWTCRCSPATDAPHRMVLMAQGGELAFVLYSAAVAAVAAGVLSGELNAVLTAIVILSMALTPLAVIALRWMLPAAPPSMDGIEPAAGLTGSVLMIGFGRFGQVASQALLARGFDVAIIDNETEMIQSATGFGFKVYYGDGTRLDVLHASGAKTARAIMVCIDDRAAAQEEAAVIAAAMPSGWRSRRPAASRPASTCCTATAGSRAR